MARVTLAQLVSALDATRRQLRDERIQVRRTRMALARGWRTPAQIHATIDRAKRLVYLATVTRQRIDRRWRVQ
jgi:hypothetical protein